MSLALQEAYADEILRSAPRGWADAATQTPGSMYRKKGKTGVTRGTVQRKALARTNPRRAAAEADLKEIELRRRYGSVYGNADKRLYVNEFLVPRAKDIAQYFHDVSVGHPQYLDAPTAYAMGDLRRSATDHPRVATVRTQFDGRQFQDAAHLAGKIMDQRGMAVWDPYVQSEHAQVQTAPMRRRSATAIRDKSRPKAPAKKKATSAQPLGLNSQGKRSWAETSYGTAESWSCSGASGSDSHFSSASSGFAEQKKTQRRKAKTARS